MSLLDKFKSAQAAQSAQAQQSEVKAEEFKTETPVTAGGLLRSKLAGLSAPPATSPVQQKVLAATQAASSSAKVQESVASIKVQTEIPPGLLELDNSLMEINGFPAEQLQQTLADLYTSLVTDQKDLPQLLRKIDINLKQYEELAYLLKPEQINLFVRGLMFMKNVSIESKGKKTTAANNIKAALKSAEGLNFDFDLD